jgi:hypothetical protein
VALTEEQVCGLTFKKEFTAESRTMKPLLAFTTKACLEVLNKVSNDQHAPTNRNRVFGDGECSIAQVESFVKFSACRVSNKCTRDGSKPTQNGTRSNQPIFRCAERTSRKSTRKDTNSKPGWRGSVRCAGKFVYNQLADSKGRHEEYGFLAL